MGKEIITFGNTEIENRNSAVKIYFLKEDVDIDNLLISNKTFSGEKVVYCLRG